MALVMVHQSHKRQSVLDEDEVHQNLEEMEEREVLKRNSNIGRMETAFELYKGKAADLMKEHEADRISNDVFKEIVKEQRDRFQGCLLLPFTFIFFATFATSTILHADIANAYVLENGLRTTLAPGATQVKDIMGAWNWLENTMSPIFFPPTNEVDYTQKDVWRPVLTYDRLVGPIQIKQLRSERSLCTKDGFKDMLCFDVETRNTSLFGKATSRTIKPPKAKEYKGGTITLADRQKYWDSAFTVDDEKPAEGSRLLRVANDALSFNPTPKLKKETFTATIYPNVLQPTVVEQLQYLKDRGWIDEQTISLTVNAALLNAELGRPRLTQFRMEFSFSRAGGVWTRLKVDTVILEFWPGMLSSHFIADAVFFIALVTATGMQVLSLTGDDPHKWRKAVKPLGLLQWAIVFVGWLCMAGLFINFATTTALKPAYEQVLEAQFKDEPAEKNTLGEKMHERLQAAVDWLIYTKALFSYYLIILIARYFTAFHAQPRLGVVTKTMEVSFVDVLHFLVVWIFTFSSFAVSGCFIFGKRLQDFSSVQASFGTCFKIFMESEYDWPQLSEDYYFTAFIWVLAFMVLLVMVMLNMVLAIVLDVYTEIRKRSGKSEPVWVTVYHMLQHMRYYRVWIYTGELLDMVPFMPAMISLDDLSEAFPAMCESQQAQIFAAARYHVQANEASNEKDARKLALAVKLTMDDINARMSQLDNGISAGFDMSAEGWLPSIAREMAVQNHMMLSLQWSLQQIEWQWQAMDAVHGSAASFPGQHKVPAPAEPTVL